MQSAKLLLVEDDPSVRQVIGDVLIEAGHQVLEAPNGEEALALLEKTPDIDLLLVDFVMPGMKGDEVARRATEMYPDIKVAFLTGYGQFLEVTGRGGNNPLINKAGRARDLVQVVGQLLHPVGA